MRGWTRWRALACGRIPLSWIARRRGAPVVLRRNASRMYRRRIRSMARCGLGIKACRYGVCADTAFSMNSVFPARVYLMRLWLMRCASARKKRPLARVLAAGELDASGAAEQMLAGLGEALRCPVSALNLAACCGAPSNTLLQPHTANDDAAFAVAFGLALRGVFA